MSAMAVDTHVDVPNGHLNGDASPNGIPKEPKFASGLILPPPEIKCELRSLNFHLCTHLQNLLLIIQL